MNKVLDELSKKISEKGLRVVFGLEAQGHIPTIERIIGEVSGEIDFKGETTFVDMAYDKYTWEKIGKEIGWCPFTAALSYFDYKNRK